jgi:putative ABC transport system ATP-binding protein
VNSPSAPLLEARELGRRHPDGKRWLLESVSVQVQAGDRMGLVGPSGAGKTLLLRALAKLDPVDCGEVFWHATPVHHEHVPAFRAQAIYLHQRSALAGETVEAALRQPLELKIHRGKSFGRNRIVGWLEELGRDGSFLDKKVRDLSGGEVQITALLRAVQLDPLLLLLDEPTSAMDPTTAQSAERLVTRWVGESAQRAFLWVSHDTEQTERVASRTIAMDSGRIVG